MRQRIENLRRLIAVLILMFLSACAAELSSQSEYRPILQDELPDALLQYSYMLRRDPRAVLEQMEQQDQTTLASWFRRVRERLGDEVDLIDFQVEWADNLCRLQSDDAGHFCGNVERKLVNPGSGFVYVTTPIASANRQVILVLSSVSPEGTLIYSFAEGGSAQLLYDYKANRSDICETEDVDYSIRSIYGMSVESPGSFILRESGNVPESEGERRIRLAIGEKGCGLKVIAAWPEEYGVPAIPQ